VKTGTVVVSLLVHAAVAGVLLTRAETKARHRAISVAVPEEKKAEKKKATPPAPPPNRTKTAKVSAPKVAPTPEPAPVHEAPVHAAPVQTAVALSNADLAPGGIAMAGTPKLATATATAVKVASVDPGAPRHRLHEPGSPNQADEACDEEATKPAIVYKTDIEYTAAAKAEGIEGKLKLKLIIGADGSVSDVEVVASVEPGLDAAAVAVVKQWRFKPALKCGRPVAGGTFVVARTFELTD
jgi:protein TonB